MWRLIGDGTLSPMTYFHGGYAGLVPGDVIIPRGQLPENHPSRTGTRMEFIRELGLVDDQWVYMTTQRKFAEYFASTLVDDDVAVPGRLYAVEPIGRIEPDPDFDTSWFPDVARAPKAKVISVVSRIVRPKSVRHGVPKRYELPRHG